MRKFSQNLAFMASIGAAAFVCAILFAILGSIFMSALPSLSIEFITTAESDSPGLGGGVANALVGSIIISLVATAIATPLALGTAIYLQKYAKETPFVSLVRFFIEVLSGTPSIVLGIFGLLVLVHYLKPYTGGFSLISGSIALSLLILPVIERGTEDAIAMVDVTLEHGSFALGATKWETIRDITIPCAISGLVTGTILGFGRAAEESAVVILTAGYSQFLPEFTVRSNDRLLYGMKIYPLQDLVGTLPYTVYHGYENSHLIPISEAFAAAFVLIAFVLLINVTAKMIFRRRQSG